MAYTEIKEKNGKKYFYRVRTIRKGKKFKKNRIYLGKNLAKKALQIKETSADYKLYSGVQINKSSDLNEIIPKIIMVLRKYHIKKAGIFGSYARGEQKKSSDVDILIKPAGGMGFKFITLALELEDELGKKVDLITYRSLHPLLKKRILNDEVRII